MSTDNKREIKFRVWDNVDYMTTFTLEDLQLRKVQFTSECVVMQFTGLQDKEGKEIYEGDLVKCGKSKDAMLAIIVFRQQAFLLQYLPVEKKKGEQIYDYMEDYKHFEVLGNVFENPELIPNG